MTDCLALKYRPTKFSDLAGSPHISKVLSSVVTTGRVHPAYLFCGGRGTGKTSAARILAAALNCTGRADNSADPCGSCPECSSWECGMPWDVTEVDGAVQGSVEATRALLGNVSSSPRGRYRVVILDECHRLSEEASSALLKTLEEPPDHLVWILCTTEPHKLLRTVVSRSLVFDFSRLSVAEVVSRLAQVARAEGIPVEDSALPIIAENTGGSLRDALMVLDQESLVGAVTASGVSKLLGVVPRRDLLEALGMAQKDQLEPLLRWLGGRTETDVCLLNSFLGLLDLLAGLTAGGEGTGDTTVDLELKGIAVALGAGRVHTMARLTLDALQDVSRLQLANPRLLVRFLLLAFVLVMRGESEAAEVTNPKVKARTSLFDLLGKCPLRVSAVDLIRQKFDAEEVALCLP